MLSFGKAWAPNIPPPRPRSSGIAFHYTSVGQYIIDSDLNDPNLSGQVVS